MNLYTFSSYQQAIFHNSQVVFFQSPYVPVYTVLKYLLLHYNLPLYYDSKLSYGLKVFLVGLCLLIRDLFAIFSALH